MRRHVLAFFSLAVKGRKILLGKGRRFVQAIPHTDGATLRGTNR